jgi:hypothetical protein
MELVEVFYLARNVDSFVADARKAAGATAAVGEESQVAGAKAGKGAKGLLGWAAAGVALYAGTKVISSSTKAVSDLATQTLALQKVTGMDTQTASEWISAAKERGIQGRALDTMFIRLSKSIESSRLGTVKENQTIAALRAQIGEVAAAGGPKAVATIQHLSAAIVRAQQSGEKARQTLHLLGIPLADISKGNTEDVLLRVADRFQTMRDPAQRAALVLQLFGRQGQQLLPVLAGGRKGVEEFLAAQQKSGNYLAGKGLTDTMKYVRQQREMSAAFAGAKLQLGQALLPVMLSLARALTSIFRALQPLLKNGPLVRTIIFGLATAFLAWKAAEAAVFLANTVLIPSLAALGVTMDTLEAGPVFLIIAGVIAIGVALYELYKHCKVFRDIVNEAFSAALSIIQTVWKWVKQYWPLLVGVLFGPFGLAVALIATHWKRVKAILLDVWNWIRKNWPLLVGALFGPFGIAIALIVTHFKKIEDAALSVIHAVERAIHKLVGDLTSVPHMITKAVKSIPGVGGVISLGSKALGAIGLQAGGTVTQSGAVLVGERGPEMVFLPQAAKVVPLQMSQVPMAGHHRGEGRSLVIEVPVMLEQKVIARAVAQVTADMMARR